MSVQVSWQIKSGDVKVVLASVIGSPEVPPTGLSAPVFSLGTACSPLPYEPTLPTKFMAWVPLSSNCTTTTQVEILHKHYPFPPVAVFFVETGGLRLNGTTTEQWFSPALAVDKSTADDMGNMFRSGTEVTLLPLRTDSVRPGASAGGTFSWHYVI
ncbi:hypothetical protein HK104_002073 [Borealophlyctis nickersoniae]|nr:hypothetical protein HK104_002073 [Borealophlyctis nickersoniae]